MVPKEAAGPRPGAPMVISDTIDGMMNPADGQRYDSKRAFYRAVRRAGCEVVGNERLPERRHEIAPGLGRDIAAVVKGER